VYIFSAHDHGGVTREYFECCLAALPTFQLHGRYALFEGETDHLLPSTDSALLRSGVFYAIGKLMAHCLLNTGIAAYGLAKPFVQYMVTPIIDDITPFTIKPDDIPDLTFREALQIVRLNNLVCFNVRYPDQEIELLYLKSTHE